MPILKWKEPPEANQGRNGSSLHAEIATELEANPGQWALILVANPGVASGINRGDLKAYRPAGTFEAVARNTRKDNDRLVADIYARYVGNGQGDA